VGRKEIMEAAQKTFISSTFWTERIGPVAALKTLEVMERVKSWDIITENGRKMREGLVKLAEDYKLEITISGIPALTTYSFNSEENLKYKTLITQEMLKMGFLASTNFYASTEHNDEQFGLYFEALADVYELISSCEKGNANISELLEGPVAHSGFKRLN